MKPGFGPQQLAEEGLLIIREGILKPLDEPVDDESNGGPNQGNRDQGDEIGP
jgi:hypothetical protein